jgi:hypothetical protein
MVSTQSILRGASQKELFTTAMFLDDTLRPAIRRFREIRLIFEEQGEPVPESVQDGWAQFERIRDHATYELWKHWN